MLGMWAYESATTGIGARGPARDVFARRRAATVSAGNCGCRGGSEDIRGVDRGDGPCRQGEGRTETGSGAPVAAAAPARPVQRQPRIPRRRGERGGPREGGGALLRDRRGGDGGHGRRARQIKPDERRQPDRHRHRRRRVAARDERRFRDGAREHTALVQRDRGLAHADVVAPAASAAVGVFSRAGGSGRPSRRRSSSPSITSTSSSRRVTVSRSPRRSLRIVAGLVVRLGQNPLDLAVDLPGRLFGVQPALLRHRDVQESRTLVAVVVDRADARRSSRTR